MTWRCIPLLMGGLIVALTATPAVAASDEGYLDAQIDAEMIAASTLVLDPAASTIDLDPSDATVEVAQEVEETERTMVRLTSDLLFDFDSADLTPAARTLVADLGADIPEGAAVAVIGHTDSIGDDAYNDELSQRRADAVATVLSEVRGDLQLAVAGHGERELLVREGEGDQSANRRVEVSYEAPPG